MEPDSKDESKNGFVIGISGVQTRSTAVLPFPSVSKFAVHPFTLLLHSQTRGSDLGSMCPRSSSTSKCVQHPSLLLHRSSPVKALPRTPRLSQSRTDRHPTRRWYCPLSWSLRNTCARAKERQTGDPLRGVDGAAHLLNTLTPPN